MKKLWDGLLSLFSDEEDPQEPFYDPVHLAAVCLLCLVAIGALYWLLWTLLAFEGGIFPKIKAGLAVLLTSKTLKDFSYLEGWLGNAVALIVCVLVLAALYRIYQAGQKRAPQA